MAESPASDTPAAGQLPEDPVARVAELRRLIDMITVNPAAALGVPDYGLRDGGPADLVVFDAPTEADALRLVARRHLVLRDGQVVARTRPAETTVTWHGAEEEVTFLR